MAAHARRDTSSSFEIAPHARAFRSRCQLHRRREATEWERIANQIDAAFIFARSRGMVAQG